MNSILFCVGKVHYTHRKRDFSLQKLGQSHSDCFLISFNRSVRYRTIYRTFQVNRIKIEILSSGNRSEQRVKLFVPVVRPLLSSRFAHCFYIDVQDIKVNASRDTYLYFSVGLPLSAKRPFPIKGDIDHVERLDMLGGESSGSCCHKGPENPIFHSSFGLPSLNPFLSLDGKNRSSEDSNNCEPLTKTNCRFYRGHILSVIAKREIIA